jgi:hypothetical protein
LNVDGVDNVDRESTGAFLDLLDSDENYRYVLLAHRREALERLRAAIPNMGTEFRRKFLEVLVHNADAALEQHGNRAAIIIR